MAMVSCVASECEQEMPVAAPEETACVSEQVPSSGSERTRISPKLRSQSDALTALIADADTLAETAAFTNVGERDRYARS
jgi:hypothetical protein